MAAAKKNVASADAAVAVGATPCTSRGPEILREGGVIAVPAGASVELVLLSCFSPGNLIVRLGQAGQAAPPSAVLTNQPFPPPNPAQIVLPPLAPGGYVLHWSFVPVGNPWQLVAEIWVNGIVMFRHLKSDASTNPFPTGFMFLEVA
jgi:hypothetical protein